MASNIAEQLTAVRAARNLDVLTVDFETHLSVIHRVFDAFGIPHTGVTLNDCQETIVRRVMFLV